MAPSDNLTLCLPRPSSGQNPALPIIVRTKKPADIPPNHVVIAVDRFGFSANNVTYQALGEIPHFRYFDFHAAPTSGEVSSKTHGLVPVWGFGKIALSTHPHIQLGERVYGYLAPTRYLLVPVSPSDVNKHAFYIPRPHLPADRRPYNQILRCSTDPQYSPSSTSEDLTMLYRPLFWTSYWCEDWLHSSSYRAHSSRILISSASAKTAFCLAYLVKKRRFPGMKVVGLTSKGNLDFTKRLGLYDEVLVYGDIHALDIYRDRWIYVDVAGNEGLNEKVIDHFGRSGRLAANIALGMTNLSPAKSSSSPIADWNTNTFEGAPSAEASAKPEQFFMVEWLNIRRHQLSPAQIFSVQNAAWAELMKDCVAWVKLERVYGADAVQEAYERVIRGGMGADKGFIWSLWDKEGDVDTGNSVVTGKL